jgi:hypothetical protein
MMIPIGLVILAMTVSGALGWLLGWITARPEQPKRWPDGSARRNYEHSGAYLGEWTPDVADRYRRSME